MNVFDFGQLIGYILCLLLLAYAIQAIFLIKPLKKYKKVGAGIAIAILALFAALSIGESLIPWLSWLIVTVFVIWRVSHSRENANDKVTDQREIVNNSKSPSIPTISNAPALPPQTVSHLSSNYFIRHWQGDYTLAVSYWINGAIVATALPLIGIALVSEQVNSADSLKTHALFFILVVVIAFMLWLWGIVGIWRSSENHVARGGSTSIAALVKVLIVLGILSMGGQFVNTIGPMFKEMTLILAGNDPVGSYKATISSDGKSLLFQGMFRQGSAKEIEKLLDTAPGVSTLVLSSGGGRILEGKLLAIAVRKRALNTYVEDICVSTCTFVFLAGKDRAATPNAKVGFHTPSFPGNDPDLIRSGTETMMDIYRQAGLSSQFQDKVRNTPSTSMWYPTRNELIEANVVTRVSLGGETNATFTAVRSKQDLLLQIRAVPLFSALERRFPGFVQKAADRGWTIKEQGGRDAQIINAMRSVTIEYYPLLIAQSDDENLEKMVRIMVDQYKAARTISYEACSKLSKAELDVASVFSKELQQREESWLIQALAAEPNLNVQRDKRTVENAIQGVIAGMKPALVDVVAYPAKYQNQPNLKCDSTIDMYEAALSLPKEQRAAALEGMTKHGT